MNKRRKRGNSQKYLEFYNSLFPKPKPSQITIFVIIAVVIIAIIVAFLIYTNPFSSSSKYPDEINSLDSYLVDCMKQRAIDAIGLVGLQGGYVNLPHDYLKTNLSYIAYGYYEGKKTLATKERIETEINYYISLTVPNCISKENFPNINITSSKLSSSVKLNDNTVTISATYPLTITKNSKSYYIKNPYEFNLPIRFGKIYQTADLIIDKEITNPNNIDLAYLSNLDLDVTLLPVDDNNIIYIVTDNQSTMNDIPFSFLFANKFTSKK